MMDKTDPICGMKGTIKAHGHYFCCEHCIRKYEEQHNIKRKEKSAPSCCKVRKKKPWYKERLYVITIATIILLIVALLIPYLNPFYDAFMDYLGMIWWAILIGFLIGGIIDQFVPRAYIEKYLARHQKRTIVYAIIFGFLMSACSHGILAIAIALYRKGANTSSVVAFLLAAPWANMPITVLLFSFFEVKALAIIFSAILVALVTGLIFQKLEKRGMVECNVCKTGSDKRVNYEFSVRQDMKRRWREYDFNRENNARVIKGTLSGSWVLTKMVMWWLLIGMIMASFARAFIPPHMFMEYMGPTLLGLLVTLFFATIIEVCSEGSSPLAFEIYNQSGAFGNSFTFLMAGVATDYTEIGLIWQNIGKRAAVWIPIITVPQIIILSVFFNWFL